MFKSTTKEKKRLTLIEKFLITPDNITLTDITWEVIETGNRMLVHRCIWNPDVFVNYMECVGNELLPEPLWDKSLKELKRGLGAVISEVP